MSALPSQLLWVPQNLIVFRSLVPGGWIEEVETSVGAYCDDGTMSPDSLLAKSGPMFLETAEKMGKPLDAIDKCRSRIGAAGFVNVHEKVYKAPLGEWAKNPVYKEAGRFTKAQLLEGLEGVRSNHLGRHEAKLTVPSIVCSF